MQEERNGSDVSVKVAGQELNVKNVKSLNTILTALSLGAIIGFGVMLWQHSEAGDKTNKEILQEIKDSNKQAIQTGKNNAYYGCMQACYLEQPQDRRNAAACERQCSPIRQ